jgi:hypothetical protein
MSEVKKYFWSIINGKHVNLTLGTELSFKQLHGTKIMMNDEVWLETLVDTIGHVARHGIDSKSNWEDVKVYVSPKVLALLEKTVCYRSCLDGKENLVGELVGYGKVFKDKNIKEDLIQIRIGKEKGLITVLDLV